MVNRIQWIFWTFILIPTLCLGADENKENEETEKSYENSVVLIETIQQAHDSLIPWNKKKLQKRNGAALVLPRQQLLTTAEMVANHTLIKVKKSGEEHPYEAEVMLIDYSVNLALLHVSDLKFWSGLEPVEWGEAKIGTGSLQHMENQRDWKIKPANIKNLFIGYRARSRARFPIMEVVVSLKSGIQGNPVVLDNKVIGMTMQSRDSNIDMFPASFLQTFVERAQKKNYKAFPQRGFAWQRVPQRSVRDYLKIDHDLTGILVENPWHYGTGSDVLKANDFIVSIGGENLSNEGHIEHEKWGSVLFDFLFTDVLKPGDFVAFEVIRDGKKMSLGTQLTDYPATRYVVPLQTVDEPTRYVLRGGMLFQELGMDYLTLWGKDWPTKAPARLGIFQMLESHLPENKNRRLVILTRVLPSAINIGYQNIHNRIVTEINGRSIKTLEDVEKAFKKAEEGFHKVQFLPGGGPAFVILPEKEMAENDKQILENFQIPQLERF